VQALFLTFFDGLSAIRQIQVLYNWLHGTQHGKSSGGDTWRP